MADTDVYIRTSDAEAGEMLRKLAELDLRSIGNENAWIIRQEWARRFGDHPKQEEEQQPQPEQG